MSFFGLVKDSKSNRPSMSLDLKNVCFGKSYDLHSPAVENNIERGSAERFIKDDLKVGEVREVRIN